MTGKEFWRGMNKSQVAAKCREIINPVPLDTEFKSDFLSDLIGEKHQFAIENNIKPVAFKKDSYNPYGRSDYYFKAKYPGIDWKPTSWRNCIYPPDSWGKIKRALRWVSRPYTSEYLRNNPVCAFCGEPSAECDHVEPEFNELVERVYGLFSDNHWTVMARRWKPMGDVFKPDPEHPAVIYIDYVHRKGFVKLQAVCKTHHVEAARERRRHDIDS